jgi:tetratricopeptide (TPR) repeat protein
LLSLGFVLALVAGLDKIIRRTRYLFIILSILVLCFSVCAYIRIGVWSNDIKLWKDAAAHFPNKSRTNNNLACAYTDQRQFVKAEEYFTRALKVAPDDLKVNMSAAAFYFNTQQFEKAIVLYDRLIRLFPLNLWPYWYKAMAYGNLSEYVKAEEAFDVALGTFKELELIYAKRGTMYLSMKQYAKARHDFELVLLKMPRDVESLIGMSNVFIAEQDLKGALGVMDKAILAIPNDENLFVQRAKCYILLGVPEQAKKDLGKAYQINPYNQFFIKAGISS